MGRIPRDAHFRDLVRNRLFYLAWQLGLGKGERSLTLRSGETLIARRPPHTDIFTASEIFLRNDYACPFSMPPIRNIVDLGGNLGYSVVFFAKRFPLSHIDTFEPHPENLRILRRNIELNGLGGRVSVFPVAAGCRNEPKFLTDNHAGSRVVSSDTPIPIKVVDWFAVSQESKIDLLKMDIEGSEYDIVFDARFPQIRITAMCIEYHAFPGAPDIAGHLAGLGYRIQLTRQRGHNGLLWALSSGCQ